MPRNNNGTYTLPQSPFTPGTTISSAAVNSDFSDIATALTGSIASNGTTPITGQLRFLAGSAAAPPIAFTTDLTSGMYLVGVGILGLSAGGTKAGLVIDSTQVGTGQVGDLLSYSNGAVIMPVGTVLTYAGSSIPTGWQLCYGQNISRTSYPELFTVLGTQYGSGDGSTTYGLPDCRGRADFGQDNMGGVAANRITVAGGNFDGTVLGGVGGQQSATISQANLPNVNFTITALTFTDPGHTHTQNSTTMLFPGSSGTAFASGGVQFNVGGTTASATTGISLNTGHAASGGSGTALATLSNAIIFNKMIFAGRP